MIKILLKIWPALLIIALYCLWVLLIRKKLVKKSKNDNIVEGEYKIVENEQKNQESSKISPFSLENRTFIMILYISLMLIIFSLIFTAFH